MQFFKNKLHIATRDIYNRMHNEQAVEISAGISSDARIHTPINYFLILVTNAFTKLGDALSSPKTVLVWLMNYVGAPVFLLSFIVPIRESGSMLPQIIISHYVKTYLVRKWIWVLGSIVQGLAVIGIGLVGLSFQGAMAGWLMIGLLVVFSLARGLCSVTSKDIIGKTIPKTRRGRLNGFSSAISGVLVVAAGIFLMRHSSLNSSVDFFAYMIIFAGGLWLIAALSYSQIIELPADGVSQVQKQSVWSSFEKFKLLKTDQTLRHFIIARGLLLCSALSAPFFVTLAQQSLGRGAALLGIFVLVGGIASIISGPLWGMMADVSSRMVLVRSAAISVILGIGVFIFSYWFTDSSAGAWIYPLAFFILAIAHEGVRLGRKTYIIDIAEGDKRTDYVSVSNTMIGALLLLVGGITAVISLFSASWVILILSLLGVIGIYASYKLPEA